MNKPRFEKGVNAEGKPLHPVCRDAAARTHIVTTVGHKWLTCVVIDRPIRLVQLDAYDHGLTEMQLQDHEKGTTKPYPLKRAVRSLRALAKERGITDGAAEALRELVAKEEA